MSHDASRADARAEALRRLPKIDELTARVQAAAPELPRWAVTRAARQVVEARRAAILGGAAASAADAGGADVVEADVIAAARASLRPSLRPVINATGVVLHTNFGRAPLAESALAHLVEVARGYSNLEFDVDERERGSRHAHLRALLGELTGAEDAVVVNNCAAAVMLGIAGMAVDREVVVSRGELVEIGGAFRVPDVMRQSGARLVEVGTTNKTHARDYEDAIGADTALLLKVHRSNFAIVGFTAEVGVAELVALGRARGVPVMVDLGSGTLVDLEALSGGALTREPTVPELVQSGADLVCFSGDKLLGGPQAGIIVGRAEAVRRVGRHPLMRALRPDKLTLAALEGTLALYRGGPAAAAAAVPALGMLVAPAAELRARAQRIVTAVGAVAGVRVEAVETRSAVGGGALPLCEPVSWAVAITRGGGGPAGSGGGSGGGGADALEAALRSGDPPVAGRIADGKLLLDVRTVAAGEEPALVAAVQGLGK